MSERRAMGDLRDRLFSFRVRLRLFFLLIVVVPMIAVTLVVFRLIAESEHGQGDARVAAREEAAISVYYDARGRADRIAARVGRDPVIAGALRAGPSRRSELRLRVEALRRATGAKRVRLTQRDRVLVDDGDPRATFPASRSLSADGRPIAGLQVSVVDAASFARVVRRVTGLDAIVRRGDELLAATIPGASDTRLPARTGTVHVAGADYQAASFTVPDFGQEQVHVAVLESGEAIADAIRRGRLLAGLVLAGFFLLALVAAGVVSRALQNQIDALLGAARRIASGDLSARVPARGRDELAQLGEEFNKMSAELERRLAELGQERLRLELSLRRIGETFASNLDGQGLVEIVVRTAVDAVDAQAGEALMRQRDAGDLERVARAGQSGTAPPTAAVEAERRVLATGEPAFANLEGGHALAHPLHAGAAAGPGANPITGVICVWRMDRPFAHRERELFHYLAGQAAVSIENVALHETVERQAVTDELTGLSNRRRFQEAMEAEVERSRRFGQRLGLVLLDIDDFKSVNDTYGHQQGDLVLREIAKVLRDSSRDIDEPARYGGEELAVVLPGTDLEGAHNLAERVREGIEQLRLPILGDDHAPPLRVTASFGAAAVPDSAADVRGLIAAADEALYQAKRAGKNRTVSAA
jgi:diguanylate cyclase (GGDEF)-like protein